MYKNKYDANPVIGVVLMVAITVAIVATVYVYVSSMLDCDTIIERGRIVYLTPETPYNDDIKILVINDNYYALNFIEDSEYELLLFADRCNCNVSITITQRITQGCSGNYYIYDNDVQILDCGEG